MTRKLAIIATAATLALGAAAPSAYAMENEFNMLTGKVHNALSSRGISTDGMSELTLNQIGQIRAILDDDGIADSQKTQRIKAIMRQQ